MALAAIFALSSGDETHAVTESPNNPRTWIVNGVVDESRVPARVPMSAEDPYPLVYINPHQFYFQLGAKSDQGLVPVFDSITGGKKVGTFNIATGVVTIDGSKTAQPTDTAGVAP